jgi:hypothetical protein
MTFTALGRVNQPTPGTPIPLSTNLNLRVAKLFIQVIPGLTGKAYIGTRTMNKSTMAGVARILWPNQAGGVSDQFLLQTEDAHDTINLSEYAIDLDVVGEGVLVSYWIE